MDDRTDRELLELAATAAGYEVLGLSSKWICQGVTDHALLIRNDRGGDSVFDPLTDDGDAIRLAIKLGLLMLKSVIEAAAHGGAAFRRAVVRAAANVGAREQ